MWKSYKAIAACNANAFWLNQHPREFSGQKRIHDNKWIITAIFLKCPLSAKTNLKGVLFE